MTCNAWKRRTLTGKRERARSRVVLEDVVGVNGTIDFDDEPQFGAVEIDDIAGDHVLATELEAASLTASEPLPEA